MADRNRREAKTSGAAKRPSEERPSLRKRLGEARRTSASRSTKRTERAARHESQKRREGGRPKEANQNDASDKQSRRERKKDEEAEAEKEGQAEREARTKEARHSDVSLPHAASRGPRLCPSPRCATFVHASPTLEKTRGGRKLRRRRSAGGAAIRLAQTTIRLPARSRQPDRGVVPLATTCRPGGRLSPSAWCFPWRGATRLGPSRRA